MPILNIRPHLLHRGKPDFSPSRLIEFATQTEAQYTAIAGLWRLECYGAQGGGTNGGRGGFSRGYMRFPADRVLYLYPGRQPTGQTGGYSGQVKTGGNSTGAYFGGGGMSYISGLRYVAPAQVIPVGSVFKQSSPGTFVYPIGPQAQTGDVSITITGFSENHGNTCITISITRNGSSVWQIPNSASGPSTYNGSGNQGDEWGITAWISTGHSPMLFTVRLDALMGIESQAGDMFEGTRLPMLVAGGGGGQGPMAGSPSGSRLSTQRFLGIDSPYGGSGSGFQVGLAGSASEGPGGGSNYGISDLFNYTNRNGERSGHGLIRLTRIGR